VKALFITTHTNDVEKLVGAWEVFGEAERFIFNYNASPVDAEMVKTVDRADSDVVFYIGAVSGGGLPSIETLKTIKGKRPFIHICCDAGDPPWHPVIERYRGCFSKQVNIDGQDSPADLTTLSPIDTRGFEFDSKKDISWGFSGNLFAQHRRILVSKINGKVFIRLRDNSDYLEYVKFIKRCRVVINTSLTGTETTQHVKGRVLETGFADACLMEPKHSPTSKWIPEDLFLTYSSPQDLCEQIDSVKDEEILTKANGFSAYVKEHYSPEKIYNQMLTGL